MEKKPLPSRLHALATWLALPVYVWQGLGVRARSHRMSPPFNPGSLSVSGQGEPLRLLVLGDSSAAGTGVERIEHSFSGALPALLAERTGRPVIAHINGMNSATAAQIRDFVVPHIEPRDFDYIALNIGTNDAKNFHSGRRFCREFGTLLYALKARFPHATIIWSGLIDLQDAPALPGMLGWILGIRSRLLDHNGRVLCGERGVLAPVPEWRAIAENFSADGFHASHKGYLEWAASMAGYIASLQAAAPIAANASPRRSVAGNAPANKSLVG